MSLFETDDALFDVNEVTGVVTSSLLKEFKPWHKPRKQFIREKQWLEQLLRLLGEARYKTVNTINYFGLPGGDLLDVNHLRKGMLNSSRAKSKKLGIHGFINSQPDYESALSTLTKLLDEENISPSSSIEKIHFEDLHKENSYAWNRIKEFGHYHFINLDFCNNVFQKETLGAIFYLLVYQLRVVAGLPWLLCVTTRLNKDSASTDVVESFQALLSEMDSNHRLEENLTNCFSNAVKELKLVSKLADVENATSFNELLQMCFVLWLIKETTDRDGDIQLKSSFKYSVDLHNRDFDMHSFVFYINPNKVVENDLLGLTEFTQPNGNIDFDDVTKKALEKLSTTLDVDDILNKDTETLNHYAGEMMTLLAMCGYDVSVYKDKMTEDFGYSFGQ
jgi:hypothetical protein